MTPRPPFINFIKKQKKWYGVPSLTISCHKMPAFGQELQEQALRQIYQCVRIGGWEWRGKPILAMPGFWKRLFLKFLPKSCQRLANVAKHWLHSAPWFHLAPHGTTGSVHCGYRSIKHKEEEEEEGGS